MDDKEPELISIKKSTYNKLIVGLIVAITVAAFLAGFGLGSDTDKDSNDETDRTSIKQPQAQSQPSSGIWLIIEHIILPCIILPIIWYWITFKETGSTKKGVLPNTWPNEKNGSITNATKVIVFTSLFWFWDISIQYFTIVKY